MKNIELLLMHGLLILLFVVPVRADIALEPFTYREDFEERELNGWFSYPIYEDAAYDSGFRINTVVNGDPNSSIEQIVTPHFNEDTYCGAQKLLDMYLEPGSAIELRYHLKTHLPAEYVKLRMAAGDDGCLDYTVSNPKNNSWERLSVSFSDIVRKNPRIKNRSAVRINGIAVLAKIPDADTRMNICLGVDDITFTGARMASFRFFEPDVREFTEWKERVVRRSFARGDMFSLKGSWPIDADTVVLDIVLFEHPEKAVLSKKLTGNNGEWSLKPFRLNLEENFYLGILSAFKHDGQIAETRFTLHIAPKDIGKTHPRLWFTPGTKPDMLRRLASDRFIPLREKIEKDAKNSREREPVESVFYDWDQLVADGWTVPWDLWHFRGWNIQNGTNAMYINAVAYALLGDCEAGAYARDILLRYTGFPSWNCPFYENRGQYSSLAYGFVSPKVALAYDFLYDLMTDGERKAIRDGIVRNMILPTHRTYVENNMIPCSTSNWLAHIMGGDLMCIAALYGDEENGMMEEYFAGALLKMKDYIDRSFHDDGSYAEGHWYYNYAMIGTGESLPSLERLFGIDLTGKIRKSFHERVWNSNIENDWYFNFGCDQPVLHDYISQGNMAWLVEKTKDPLLAWFYNDIRQKRVKKGEDVVFIQELLHETEDIPRKSPYDLNPSRIFPEQGRTVFKSGWGPEDFAFSMTTGPYFNHQDIHMGSFWFADLGSRFIVDYWDGDKYGDPRYYGYKIQPIAHSTILIDHNEVSQRSGDPYNNPEGFDDRAFIYQYLDGSRAAFSSGDIGRLYWGKVREMRRNVLYLKPRTILMIDTITPQDDDVDVTLLFQSLFLRDITPDIQESQIESGGNVLHIHHLYPVPRDVRAVERPHFMNAFNRYGNDGSPYPSSGPLEREGMLQVTASTNGSTLVVATLMKATSGGQTISLDTMPGDGYISGHADGMPFVFSTKPGERYRCGDIMTDALAFTADDSTIFAALCKVLSRGEIPLFEADKPITCEIAHNSITYYTADGNTLRLSVEKKPSRVLLNGQAIRKIVYDANKKIVTITVPGGTGSIRMSY